MVADSSVRPSTGKRQIVSQRSEGGELLVVYLRGDDDMAGPGRRDQSVQIQDSRSRTNTSNMGSWHDISAAYTIHILLVSKKNEMVASECNADVH